MTEFPSAPPLAEPTHEWGRLDPRMIIVRPLNEMLGLLIPIVAFIVLGSGEPWRLAAGGATVGALLLYGLFAWLTTKYRITETQVELHKGVVHKQQLAIPRDRIRTVDLTAKPGHRLFGLSAVRVGTGEQSKMAGDGVILDAVTAAEADRLRQVFLERGPSPTLDTTQVVPADQADTPVAKLDSRWYRYAPLSMSGLITIAVAAGFTLNLARELHLQFSEVTVIRAVFRWLTDADPLTVIPTAAAAVVVLSTVTSFLTYLLQNHAYRLTRHPDGTLRVRRGLLTTHSVSIEESRLRGVTLHEPLLLRWGGGARLTAVTTGLGKATGSSLLLPPAPRPEADRVAAEVLHSPPAPSPTTPTPASPASTDLDPPPPATRTQSSQPIPDATPSPSTAPTTAEFTRHPAAAKRRRLVRAVAPTAVLAATLLALASLTSWPHWPWITAAALLPLSVLIGLDRYRNLGHALTDRYLLTRSGSLDRETVALQRTGIIGWKITRTFFQRRSGLLSITAVTAAGRGHYTITDIAEAPGVALAEAAIPNLLRPFLTRVRTSERRVLRSGR